MRQDLRRERPNVLTLGSGREPGIVSFSHDFVRQTIGPISLDGLISHLSEGAQELNFSTYDIWALPNALTIAAINELCRRYLERKGEAAAAIASLHRLLAEIQNTEWIRVVPRISSIERVLDADPSHIYGRMDPLVKDSYRQAVAAIGLKARVSEREVAEVAVRFASADSGNHQPERTHVGFYLIGPGKSELLRFFGESSSGWSKEQIASGFIGLGAVLVAALFIASWEVASSATGGIASGLAISILLVFSAGPCVFGVVKHFSLLVRKPHRTPRLNFEPGMDPEAKTLVVIPCLLSALCDVDRLCEQILMHRLRNRLDHVSYALLTDWADSEQEVSTDDQNLLGSLIRTLGSMNAKHGWSTGGFALLHRARVWSVQEGRWMGRGRKLGKLKDLSTYLHEGGGTQFATVYSKDEWLRGVVYVVTVDEDTELPWGCVGKLISTIHHPLNRPRLAADGSRVEWGNAVIQPTMTTFAFTKGLTPYQKISAFGGGLKAYQSSAPNFYHDLIGSGCYLGKGIYSVQCASVILRKYLGDDEVLSHDLIEGCLLRGDTASDIELFEAARQTQLP
ncbi:hypothetical protein Y886_35870, partial [Xanthomonas hyacinthi DSM 19077]